MSLKVTDLFQTKPCSRCGGSGHYSFNQIDGTRCYGCGGRGWQFTKAGAAARDAWRAAFTKTVRASEIKPGDKIMESHNGIERCVTVSESGPDELNVGQGRWNLRFEYPNKLGLGGMGTFADSEIRFPASVADKGVAYDSVRHMPGAIFEGEWPA